MPKTVKKRSRGKGEGPLPGGAGLIRFFEDETPGIKVSPSIVVIIATLPVIATVVAHLFA